jgi:putative FmdB family regulatory protein
MPLYEFRCRGCGGRFEATVPYGTMPPCPACGGESERVPSTFAGPFTVGMRGYAARRSNAQRAAREERRREQRELRREREQREPRREREQRG